MYVLTHAFVNLKLEVVYYMEKNAQLVASFVNRCEQCCAAPHEQNNLVNKVVQP